MSAPLVVLDLGATLVTGPDRGPASRIAERIGLAPDAKARLAHALMTTRFTAPEQVAAFVAASAGRDADDDALRRAVADVWHAQHAEAEPIPGAAAALARLAAAGLRFAVVSNIWEPYLHAVRAHFGAFLDAHVPPEQQVFSCREGRAKPAPELFLHVLGAAGIDPADAVMVGDSYAEDIAPAAALGLGTVWVLHRPSREAGALARVLNGEATPPSRTVTAIADVTPALVAAATRPRPVHAG